MAHMIDTQSRAQASYASTQREWHGLGELMPPDALVQAWQRAAGMDYTVRKAFVHYTTMQEQGAEVWRTVQDRVVLFRDDTQADLGIVSASYQIVQPREVLEFFREWAEMGGLTIESAGVLFGGKRYFATAKLAPGVCIDADVDKVVPYALLSTSADGSLATECRWTTVRTVCNNTLTLATAGAAAHKTTHRSVFKPQEARTAVEAAHAEFGAFMEAARQMASVKLSLQNAQTMTEQLLAATSAKTAQVQQSAGYKKILELFDGTGKGCELATAQGTEWGWLNAVTEYVDHDVRARTEENRQASALWGAGNALKNRALAMLAH